MGNSIAHRPLIYRFQIVQPAKAPKKLTRIKTRLSKGVEEYQIQQENTKNVEMPPLSREEERSRHSTDAPIRRVLGGDGLLLAHGSSHFLTRCLPVGARRRRRFPPVRCGASLLRARRRRPPPLVHLRCGVVQPPYAALLAIYIYFFLKQRYSL